LDALAIRTILRRWVILKFDGLARLAGQVHTRYMSSRPSNEQDFAVNAFRVLESISEGFDNAFGKLPVAVQVTIITVFSFLFDA
jgi:hypothetical protein